jgi:hypothetical protein
MGTFWLMYLMSGMPALASMLVPMGQSCATGFMGGGSSKPGLKVIRRGIPEPELNTRPSR